MSSTSKRMRAFHHIVIAEDDLDTREILADMLRDTGYHVTSVPDGRGALDALLSGTPPDLLLLDMWMDGMTGWELLALKHRSAAADVPTILMTGFDDLEFAHPVFEHKSVVGYLRKPMSPEQVLAEVGKALAPQSGIAEEDAEALAEDWLEELLSCSLPSEVLDQALSRALSALGGGDGAAFILTPDGGRLERVLSQGNVSDFLASDVSFLSLDGAHDAVAAFHRQAALFCPKVGVENGDWVAHAPLCTSERCMGVLIVRSQRLGEAVPEDRDLLQNVARQAAVALERLLGPAAGKHRHRP